MIDEINDTVESIFRSLFDYILIVLVLGVYGGICLIFGAMVIFSYKFLSSLL